ncbi:UDP-2,4-diacetamido-2,4,6-trideoxy-beta-L-altropyranose hydrolase [Hippea maritima]|uniref:Pseudaminic acid biosynthesis-associated protein PseG n=1 Tax=Hippea maritima (strain ATCC 700847 / DSM 10411 / MH2) TaxID=760142 RepID=F2LUK1_HIPMA|nr:UDP-2,4-diacetamido-2,4,6-trideoxy-beta-L-altropyranose hydrolase [Hippea maritima]AEA34591.1 pseudaminic acid biosynthesis-associated protein PseG [Hippea maritima DSM 10411]
MKTVKVGILTEGSNSIGFGHITRCLSLYQAFKKKNIKPKFFINGDDSIIELIKDTNFEVIDWLKMRKEVFDKLKDFDIVIIDSYLADKEFYDELSKLVKLPVYMDDNKRIDYPKGVVINGNIHAKELNYPKKDGVIYLLGTEYTPLRKEFWDVPEKTIREKVQSVMITFGGEDAKNMTPKILRLLSENYPELKKNVVIGKGFRNIEDIKAVADKNTNLIYYPDAEGMKQIMFDADIAISAGGQTLYELARVGVPTIAIAIADNQLGNVRTFEKLKIIKFVVWWEHIDKINIDGFQEQELRKKISKKMQELIDGNGSRRIIKNLIKSYEVINE